MSESVPRAALYTRVSTRGPKNGKEQDPGTSAGSLRIRRRHGMARRRRIRRPGERSQAREGPAAVQSHENAASRRELDMVLTSSLDRFSREGIAKTFDHLRHLGSYGVKFRSFNESFLDTTAEFGELVAAIFAFFASFERRRIVERIGAGLARARAQGRTLGRPRVIVNRAKVWSMRDAGKSIREIAAALKLSHGTVQRIVSELKPES